MMSLPEIKAHLRVEHDHEDTLILTYWDAAEGLIEQHLGEDLPDPMPPAVEAALLLLIGDLYENRARQSDIKLNENNAYSLLLNPYRSMSVAP